MNLNLKRFSHRTEITEREEREKEMASAFQVASLAPSIVLVTVSSAVMLKSRHSIRKLRAGSRRGNVICAANLPTGVEPPKEEPKLPAAFWGFTKNAEIWNSRAAMIGIISIVIVEFVAKRGLLEIMGIEIGKGLDLPL